MATDKKCPYINNGYTYKISKRKIIPRGDNSIMLHDISYCIFYFGHSVVIMPLTVNYLTLEENKFDYPFRIFISGSSQSGKTHFARELLYNNDIFKQSVKYVQYCHPDYLTDLPVYWHETLDVPVSYRSGIPSLDDMCRLEPHTCLVLDDLYEEAVTSRQVDYLFRVLSGKKNISVIIMSQRYFSHGRFGMNIRNNCNFTVMMRNSDGRANSRIATSLGLTVATNKAIEDSYADNYYPYIFVDSSPRGQVSGYRCYTSIFGSAQTVFNQRGMKAYIINEHDFLSNFNIINRSTAKRIDKRNTEPESDGIDETDSVRDTDGESKQQTREKVEKTCATEHVKEHIKERPSELPTRRKRKFDASLY